LPDQQWLWKLNMQIAQHLGSTRIYELSQKPANLDLLSQYESNLHNLNLWKGYIKELNQHTVLKNQWISRLRT